MRPARSATTTRAGATTNTDRTLPISVEEPAFESREPHTPRGRRDLPRRMARALRTVLGPKVMGEKEFKRLANLAPGGFVARHVTGTRLSLDQARILLRKFQPRWPSFATQERETQVRGLQRLLLHLDGGPEEQSALFAELPDDEWRTALQPFLDAAPDAEERATLLFRPHAQLCRSLESLHPAALQRRVLSQGLVGRRCSATQMTEMICLSDGDRLELFRRMVARWDGKGRTDFLVALMPEEDQEEVRALLVTAPQGEQAASLGEPSYVAARREIFASAPHSRCEPQVSDVRTQFLDRWPGQLSGAQVYDLLSVVTPVERLELLVDLLPRWDGSGDLSAAALLFPGSARDEASRRLRAALP